MFPEGKQWMICEAVLHLIYQLIMVQLGFSTPQTERDPKRNNFESTRVSEVLQQMTEYWYHSMIRWTLYSSQGRY